MLQFEDLKEIGLPVGAKRIIWSKIEEKKKGNNTQNNGISGGLLDQTVDSQPTFGGSASENKAGSMFKN